MPVRESVKIFWSWTVASLPAELHAYERGGHNFGMMTTGKPVDG